MNTCKIYQTLDDKDIYSHVKRCITNDLVISNTELCHQPTNTPIIHSVIMPPSTHPTKQPTTKPTDAFLPNFHVQDVVTTSEGIMESTNSTFKSTQNLTDIGIDTSIDIDIDIDSDTDTDPEIDIDNDSQENQEENPSDSVSCTKHLSVEQ